MGKDKPIFRTLRKIRKGDVPFVLDHVRKVAVPVGDAIEFLVSPEEAYKVLSPVPLKNANSTVKKRLTELAEKYGMPGSTEGWADEILPVIEEGQDGTQGK